MILVGINHREVTVDATIDTGFTGDLSLSKDRIDDMGWQFDASIPTVLGDGSEREIKYYRGIVMWGDAPRIIEVMEGGARMLVGTALLRGSDLFIRMKLGGEVRITEIT